MFGLGLLSDLSHKALFTTRRHALRVQRLFTTRHPALRVQRKLAVARGLPIPKGFFDDFPIFYSTSHTGATPNRLNNRYRAMIEWNKDIICGKRILDLASHDGRWSFAAMKCGANSVLGIEGRNDLVEKSINTFEKFGIPNSRFICGDIFERLDDIEPGSIDTIFIFGIFYHIENHALLLSKLARLNPEYLIFDTAIAIDRKLSIARHWYISQPTREP